MPLNRWTYLTVTLLLSFLTLTNCSSADDGATIGLREISDDFEAPVAIVPDPSKSGYLLIAERSGLVVSLDTASGKTREVLDIEDLIGDTSPRGLLGIASNVTNHEPSLFVSYLDPQGDLVVGRFNISGTKTLDEEALSVVIKVARLAPNTLGSNLAIDPDGTLFIGTSDGEGAALPRSHTAQLPHSLLGKVIRITPKDRGGYVVPANNPFLGQPGYQPEIWALGFRSPEALAFNSALNQLIVLDSNEKNNEINLVERGRNYGWDSTDGTSCTMKDCPSGSLIAPVVTIPKATPESRLIGGISYRGAQNPKLQNAIVFAETTTGTIYSARQTGAGAWEYGEIARLPKGAACALGTNSAGEIFIASTAGRLFTLR